MNKKVCGRCGNFFDDNLVDCPFCNSNNNTGYNVHNQFMNSNNNEVQLNNQNNNIYNNAYDKFDGINKINYEYNKGPKSSIIMDRPVEDSVIEEKIEKVNRKNEHLKKRKKKKKINNYFSYLLLIQGMIILFICVLSTINDFNLPILCHYGLTAIALMVSFNFSFRNKEFGVLLAALCSISMICMLIEGDYVTPIIGIYLLTYTFVYLVKK